MLEVNAHALGNEVDLLPRNACHCGLTLSGNESVILTGNRYWNIQDCSDILDTKTFLYIAQKQ